MVLVVCVIAGATVQLYAPHLDAPFVFDDFPTVLENDRIEKLWPPAWAYGHPKSSPLAGRPASSLTFTINRVLHGFEPRGYRLFNVAIHLVNAVLMLFALRRLLGSCPALGLSPTRATATSASIALLWSIHPLQTEAIEYVSQRTEPLAGLAYLATFVCAQRGFSAPSRGSRTAWFASAATASVIGVLCKEVVATAPLVVWLYDRAFVSGRGTAALRQHAGLYAGFAVTGVMVVVILWIGPRSTTVGTEHGISSLEYLRTQSLVIAEYLRACFWPSPLRLSYGTWTAKTWSDVLPSGLLVPMTAVVTLWACLKCPRLGFAGAWFFLILAPSSSIIPVTTEIGAERRMYLPLASVIGLSVVGPLWAARAVLRRRGRGSGASLWFDAAWLGAALTLAIPLGWRTSNRLDDYRSRVAIWRADVQADPENPVALYNLAAALFDAKRYAEAAPVVERAVWLLPTMDRGLVLLAATYVALGRPEGAIPSFRGLTASHPDLPRLHWRYGRACLRSKAADEAVEPLRRAVALQPDLVGAWADLAEAMAATGRLEEALDALDEAIARADASSRIRLLKRRRAFEARLDTGVPTGAPMEASP
jgi:hypothetical protein